MVEYTESFKWTCATLIRNETFRVKTFNQKFTINTKPPFNGSLTMEQYHQHFEHLT